MSLFFKGAWAFFRALPWQLYAALVAAALCWGAWHLHTAAVKQANTQGYIAGSQATADKFNAAQRAVDAKALAGKAKTEARQDAIAKETSDALYKSVDDIDARARAIGLRHDQARDGDGAGGPSDPGQASEAPGQSCPSPTGDGLSWGAAFPLMVQAQKNLAQLNAILDFEEAQDALAAQETVIADTPAK